MTRKMITLLLLISLAFTGCAGKQKEEQSTVGADFEHAIVPTTDIVGSDECCTIDIEGTKVNYVQDSWADSAVLEDYLGEALEDESCWYKVKDVDKVKYLIRKEDMTLWEQDSFSGILTGAEFLEKIYHAAEPADIAEIRCLIYEPDEEMPDGYKQTEEKLSEKQLEMFMEIFQAAELDCEEHEYPVRFSYDEEDYELLQMRVTRYITIVFNDGTTLGDIRYHADTGVIDRLGQYNRFTSEPIGEDYVTKLNDILRVQ